MLLIETGLVLLALLIAFIYPQLGSRWFENVERRLSHLSRRRTLSVVLVGVTALTLRSALLPIEPIPVPGVHDEFSYLLMADTFAHGRLSNPTHPMWVHFETFHVNQKPTYASMYYPAQGAFLALGQIAFGHPFWGVWLSGGLMCAAICWMLQGWFPPFWALLGALLAVIRLATFSYWINSYWGGAVAALGGALALGALPRIKRNQDWRHATLMGVGFALLATSRPYEGLFFSLPIAAALFLWTLRHHSGIRGTLVPLGVVLCLTITFLMYYFWRVTGSPFRAPFFVNLATYDPVPYFPWQSVKAWPDYHHAIMKNFYSVRLLQNYELGRSHPIVNNLIKADLFGFFYLGPLFTVSFVLLGIVLPIGFSWKNLRPRTRILLLVAAAMLLGESLPVFYSVHYAAPLVCVIYALLLTAMQCLRKWHWRGRPTGLALVRSIPVLASVLFFLRVLSPILPISNSPVPQTWCSPYDLPGDRSDVQMKMENLPGTHLLLVHYAPNHDPRSSWVSNGANIDNSKVVWANDMGPEQNRELIEYFKDRRVWQVQPDAWPVRISPYAYTPQEHNADASH
jgi:hypothetical protein